MTNLRLLFTKVLLATAAVVLIFANRSVAQEVEHVTNLITKQKGQPVRVTGWERAVTKESFKPPIEITFVVKTDSTNIRLAYAADQVIFNWELNPAELRVDGGPADGQHKKGAGNVHTKVYQTIKWVVTPTGQWILVNGELRFHHAGDYSKINAPISVFSGAEGQVTLKSLKTKIPDQATLDSLATLQAKQEAEAAGESSYFGDKKASLESKDEGSAKK